MPNQKQALTEAQAEARKEAVAHLAAIETAEAATERGSYTNRMTASPRLMGRSPHELRLQAMREHLERAPLQANAARFARLQKKVSDLEQQLYRAREEAQETWDAMKAQVDRTSRAGW